MSSCVFPLRKKQYVFLHLAVFRFVISRTKKNIYALAYIYQGAGCSSLGKNKLCLRYRLSQYCRITSVFNYRNMYVLSCKKRCMYASLGWHARASVFYHLQVSLFNNLHTRNTILVPWLHGICLQYKSREPNGFRIWIS